MKVKIEVNLAPFSIPNFVRVEDEDTGKERTAIALEELDGVTLDRLCDEFRTAVFKKAGCGFPPEESPICTECRQAMR